MLFLKPYTDFQFQCHTATLHLLIFLQKVHGNGDGDADADVDAEMNQR